MGEWHVDLHGRNQDLEALARSRPSGSWAITQSESGYCITSDNMSGVADLVGVLNIAASIVKQINAVAKLLKLGWEPISSGRVWRIGDAGRPEYIIQGSLSGLTEFSGVEPLPPAVMAADAGVAEDDLFTVAAEAIALKPALADAVDLFNTYRSNWTQLWKIIELVKTEFDHSLFFSWIPKNDYELLRHTAQFPESAGVTSRHAVLHGSPHPNPMQLSTAQKHVYRVLMRGLLHK